MEGYSAFMDFWYPLVVQILWLGFLVYLFGILQETYKQARERKRLSKVEKEVAQID